MKADRTTIADAASEMPASHFERIVPLMAEEPAMDLGRIEDAGMRAKALGFDVDLATREVGQVPEPDVRCHVTRRG